MIRATSSAWAIKLLNAFSVKYPTSKATYSCDLSSAHEAFAIERKRENSAADPLSKPSAIFDIVETAARRICSLNPKSLLKRPSDVDLQTAAVRLRAFCHAIRSSNLIILSLILKPDHSPLTTLPMIFLQGLDAPVTGLEFGHGFRQGLGAGNGGGVRNVVGKSSPPDFVGIG